MQLMSLLAMLSLGTLGWAERCHRPIGQCYPGIARNYGNARQGNPGRSVRARKVRGRYPHMVKGGFIFGGKGDKGVATCRMANGWSAPAFITISGGSWGLQIGVEAVDVVMIIQNEKGMQRLLSSNFQVGGDSSAAAGPVGRHAEAGTDWKMDTEILTYSRAQGCIRWANVRGCIDPPRQRFPARDVWTQGHNSGFAVGQSASSSCSPAVPCGNSRSKSPSRSRREN